MINPDPPLAHARAASLARSPGDGDLHPLNAQLTDWSDSEDTEEIQDTGMGEPGRRSLGRLRLAVAEILNALNSALKEEWGNAEECAQRASSILKSPSLFALTGVLARLRPNEPPIQIRGELAPWQVRQVDRYIESHLEVPLQIRDLAALVRLSPSHFCRAFRSSFDASPHSYVMRRRVERAQGLLLATNAPLAQIAVECGMADQAHFNRLFRRFVGNTPGAWRRARAIPKLGTFPADEPPGDTPASRRKPIVIPPVGESLRTSISGEARPLR
jgi:AraC-like DNA-binding protein